MYEWSLDGNDMRGPLIVCVAGAWRGPGSFCLPPPVARELLLHSESNAFVRAAPSLEDMLAPDFISIPLTDILSDAALEQTIFLTNTYHAATAIDALERVQRDVTKLGANRRLLVKLEVLDNKLFPMVDETLSAINLINKNVDAGIIPLIPADIALAKEIATMMIVGVRVLVGDIGKGNGIKDPSSFQQICEHYENLNLPVIAEGGISEQQHVMTAFTCGATAVLCNSCFKTTNKPMELLQELMSGAYRAIDQRKTRNAPAF
jgi:thiazole synthase ThiGH ThiG subunit